MKETTFMKLLEVVLLSNSSTKETLDMLELLRKLKLAQKVLDKTDAVLMGTKLYYLKNNTVEDLA